MQFAVNYSPILADLVSAGQVRIDCFKCPDWPDLLQTARPIAPYYIHFPLGVGNGLGCPVDGETHSPADLERIVELLENSGTPYVNTHFVPAQKYYPNIPSDSRAPRHIQQVVSNTLRDLEPLIKRFGAEHILVENVINDFGYLTLAVFPEVIARILDETGCALLFDLSHARLAARNLGLDERDYCLSLPLDRIREIHVTGMKILDADLLARVKGMEDSGGFLGLQAGQWLDHFPMAEADWEELEWLMENLAAGKCGQPWVIAFEYGGVGGFWELISDRAVLLEQVPRMASMIKRQRRGQDAD